MAMATATATVTVTVTITTTRRTAKTEHPRLLPGVFRLEEETRCGRSGITVPDCHRLGLGCVTVVKVKWCKRGSVDVSIWITVVGSLIAALIGVLGVLWVIQNTSGENLKQFRRNQPQYDRYAAVLNHATAMRNRVGFSTKAITDPEDPNYFNYDTVVRPGGAILYTTPNPPGAPPRPTATPSGPTTIESVHGKWQNAYTALDQAVSEVEIAASPNAIEAARALRDKIWITYRNQILAQIAAVRTALKNNYDYPTDEDLANALVGVPANSSPPPNQAELMKKSVDDLTNDYRDAVRGDLGLG